MNNSFTTENPQQQTQPTKLPSAVIWAVVVICLLPFCLNWMGVSFSAIELGLDLDAVPTMRSPQLLDAMHRTLAGSFIQTILEWIAFCATIFTAILAFSHFTIKRDVITPILGVTLLCAGIMDAFHTAADRLIDAASETSDLIPFTWALCRLGNALLTMLGVGLLLLINPDRWQRSVAMVSGVSLGFGILVYSVIYFCTLQETLPQTMFSHGAIARPWDVISLVLFAISGIFIYPLFYRKYPSLFAHALIVSTIPNSATQIYMAFGESALFDDCFNIANFLKIIAYLVPLTGLILDYTYTHRELKCVNDELCQVINDRDRIQTNLQASEAQAQIKLQQLEQTLQELQKTQLQLIQNEKMSSLGQLVIGIIQEIGGHVGFIHGNISHVSNY
ncbi:hypothetical protein [Microseira wollei]|uniref:Integral membrane sensor signal transduction histidine kinase n=1 Tax=Microseira wollei NIES-4236 TaxID=2530354 RepID=A0AAV3X7Y2_9CYAN|nr:hypothetical protein [Microseira wollei]GET36746.1 integral membrane sensor signal transduction histidine kinase [Microseira wollei NIES-4236]